MWSNVIGGKERGDATEDTAIGSILYDMFEPLKSSKDNLRDAEGNNKVEM